MRWIIAGVLGVVVTGSAHAQINHQTAAEIRAMGWVPAQNQHLASSNSTISLIPGYSIVLGSEAIRVREIVNGQADPSVEADAINFNMGAEAVYQFIPAGYVSASDWGDLDPDRMMEEIKQNDVEGNRQRVLKGIPPIHTLGWVQKPTLNAETHTVSWVIEAVVDDGSRVVNAVALKLARSGFERITYIDDAFNSSTAVKNLVAAANAQTFDPGSRYTDYVLGTDRVAEFGIAGLVAGALGVKLLKASVLVGLLAFAKKGTLLIVLPCVWLWRALVGRRKLTADEAPPARVRVEPPPLS